MPSPVIFKITNKHPAAFVVHCGVLEFSAPRNHVFLPRWVCLCVSLFLGVSACFSTVFSSICVFCHTGCVCVFLCFCVFLPFFPSICVFCTCSVWSGSTWPFLYTY